MRILMITDVYFPRVNGVSTSIQTLTRELKHQGHEVRLIGPAYPQHEESSTELTRVSSRYLFFDPEDRLMRKRELIERAGDLRAQGFDLVHIHTPFVAHFAGVALSRASGVPRIETCHTVFEEYAQHYLPALPKSVLKKLARRLTGFQCNRMHGVVAPSTAMAGLLADYGVRRPTAVIPTGLEPGVFRRGDGRGFRVRHGIDLERPCLVFVGRVAHEKNIDFLIRAIDVVRRSIPTVLLLIAGQGPARAHLEKLVARMGLANSVRFIGYLKRESGLLDCYRAADAFVFASRTETQGLVLLEAMAQGVPVIATAVLGTRDTLRHGSGAVVVEQDVHAFAAAATKVLREPALRKRLGRLGKAYAKTWASHTLAAKLVDFYGDIIEARPRALRSVLEHKVS